MKRWKFARSRSLWIIPQVQELISELFVRWSQKARIQFDCSIVRFVEPYCTEWWNAQRQKPADQYLSRCVAVTIALTRSFTDRKFIGRCLKHATYSLQSLSLFLFLSLTRSTHWRNWTYETDTWISLRMNQPGVEQKHVNVRGRGKFRVGEVIIVQRFVEYNIELSYAS